MAIVEVEDLRNYMDISFTNVQETAVELILAGIQGELETYLRRPVEDVVAVETHRVPRDHVSYPFGSFFSDESAAGPIQSALEYPFALFLKNTPVTVVDTVILVPAQNGSSAALVAEDDYVTRPWGIEVSNVSIDDQLIVTYTAGGWSEAANAYFKLAILRAASRETQNLHDDTVGLKDLETRNVAPLVTGFTEEEKAGLYRWRRKI